MLSQTRLRQHLLRISCKFYFGLHLCSQMTFIISSNQKAMDSLAFTRDMKPASPLIKAEDPLPPGDNTATSSWLNAIKQKLFDMFRKLYSHVYRKWPTQYFTEDFGVRISMSQFPWKSLLCILAKNGLVLRGYPDILMPGEVRGNNKTKGIGDLFSTEQVDLATSLELVGKTSFPLSLSRAPHSLLDGK
jgi:hypothetical protein